MCRRMCFSCGSNPAPANHELACRACIKYVRKELSKIDKAHEDAHSKHARWVNSLSPDEYTHYALRFGLNGLTALDPPVHEWPFPFPRPTTKEEISKLLRREWWDFF